MFIRDALVLGVIASGAVTGPGAPASALTRQHAPVTLETRAAMSSPHLAALVRLGSRGATVRELQRRLSSLGYWLGPRDGVFGDSTQQAVFALQKAASLPRDGVVGSRTWRALERGVRPHARSSRGYLVEINLHTDLLLFVRNARVLVTLNVSTGGGYRYSDGASTALALTPRGVFHVLRQVDGLVVAPLGELWRPKYFVGGYAIHGSASVPPVPVSHGCVRVSIAAINWIWASNRMPLGTKVWIY
ncbi:MAG TPA: L,D-transpeptidase family protein [Acidimicrobiales bacterium]|nr:L,D-transpeptidase family protein [Acidimicrobiales bacterium]